MANAVRIILQVDDQASPSMRAAAEATSRAAEAEGRLGFARGLTRRSTTERTAATDALTDADKRALAAVLAAQAGERARADALGVSVRQMRQVSAVLAQAAPQAASSLNSASGAVTQMRYQLIDIGQGLASGQSPLMILAQQSGQVGQALMLAKAEGQSFGSVIKGALGPVAGMGPALLALAAAAGAVYVAYRALSAEAERNAEINAVVAAGRKAAQPMIDAERDALIDLRVANDELTEAEGRAMKARIENLQQISAALAPALAEIAKIRGGEGSVGRALGDMVDGSISFAWVDALTTSSAEAQAEIDKLMEGNSQLATRLKQSAFAVEEKARAEGEGAKRTRSYAAAQREAEKAERERLKSIEDYPKNHLKATMLELDYVEKQFDNAGHIPRFSEAYTTLMTALSESEATGAVEFWRDLNYEIMMARDKLSAPEFAQLSERSAELMSAAQIRRGQSTTGNVISAVADPIGFLASDGGIVGMVTKGVLAAGNLDGTLKGASGLVDSVIQNALSKGGGSKVGGFIGDIVSTVPTALVRGLPRFVSGLIDSMPSVLSALARMIPELGYGVIELMVVGAPRIGLAILDMLIDPNTWIKVGASFIEGVATALTRTLEGILGLGGRFSDNQVGGKGTKSPGDWWSETWSDFDALISGERSRAGGEQYISRAGLRVVHPGESIVTAGQVNAGTGGGLARGRGMMRGSGGRVYIEIDADSLSDTFGSLRDRGYRLGGA